MTDRQYVTLKFEPGIVRDNTLYDNKGHWYNGNWVRFRHKNPEVMGGWESFMTDTFLGHARSLTQMAGYSEYVGGGYRKWLVMGTDEAFYVSDETDLYRLRPYYLFNTAILNAVQTTNGSDIVRINDPGRPTGLQIGDQIELNVSSDVAGITTVTFNQIWTVVGLPTATSFTIDVNQNANATVAAGGGNVSVTYYTTVSNYDYWSQDNFGFYLIANLRDDRLYYYPNNFLTVPVTVPNLFPLISIPSASDVPVVSRLVCISSEESHCISFGCNPIGDTDQDPMFIRWSSSESLSNWTPLISNTAGGYRLSVGNEIIAIQETRTEIVIWTDQSMYSMRWIGGQLVFGFTLIGNNVSVIGLNARCATNDFVAWMGNESFYIYDGRIREVECPVSDYIFTQLNYSHLDKIYGFTNSTFSEVCWLIPTGAATEPNFLICYNYADNIWYYGSIDRTAWLDRGPESAPVAAHSSNGMMYYQETGLNNTTLGADTPINAYIESSPIELTEGGEGMHFMFIDRVIPDITFRNSTANEPEVRMTFTMQNYPGAANATSQSAAEEVQQSFGMAVGEFTQQLWVRLRGRSLKFKCETPSNAPDITWRLGAPRVSLRPDGRK